MQKTLPYTSAGETNASLYAMERMQAFWAHPLSSAQASFETENYFTIGAQFRQAFFPKTNTIYQLTPWKIWQGIFRRMGQNSVDAKTGGDDADDEPKRF